MGIDSNVAKAEGVRSGGLASKRKNERGRERLGFGE
jgi:hypothetical protein